MLALLMLLPLLAQSVGQSAAPDILILDRRLPDGDGIDFLKKLRETESASMIVLVLTAYGDVQNAVEALKAGASDYLTKPVQLTDLIIKLRKVLEARGLRDRLAAVEGIDEARMNIAIIMFFLCALLAVAGAVLLILAHEPIHSALA